MPVCATLCGAIGASSGAPTNRRGQETAAVPPTRGLTVEDSPAPGTFEAIYAALDACSRPVIGPAQPRLLVIPIRDDAGVVAGGLWGYTLFSWLHVQMLFVPDALRGKRVGSALMASAEAEARNRGCHGIHLDAFSFQAAAFYLKLGYTLFGKLTDCPPGHDRLFLQKPLSGPETENQAQGTDAATNVIAGA